MVDFIFMLTREDRTIEDCLEVVDAIAPLGLRHIGYKDVGVPVPVLAELDRRIKAAGATSWMEIVAPDPEAALPALDTAARIGSDRVMGGTASPAIMERLSRTGMAYLPFPGRTSGHPTVLHGSAEEIAADCARIAGLGCAGVDLLAYRAVDADPLALLRAARAATPGFLVVAGSIDTPERIAAVHGAGADAFTIGSAIFAGALDRRKGSYLGQIAAVRDVVSSLPSR